MNKLFQKIEKLSSQGCDHEDELVGGHSVLDQTRHLD